MMHRELNLDVCMHARWDASSGGFALMQRLAVEAQHQHLPAPVSPTGNVWRRTSMEAQDGGDGAGNRYRRSFSARSSGGSSGVKGQAISVPSHRQGHVGHVVLPRLAGTPLMTQDVRIAAMHKVSYRLSWHCDWPQAAARCLLGPACRTTRPSWPP